MEPVTVTRSLRLPTSVDEAWSSLADAEGLSTWLADSVTLDQVAGPGELRPGTAGVAIDGAVVRRLVVTEVDACRSIGFVWWDEAQPEQASVVTISLDEDDQQSGTAITVTERLMGAAVASVAAASVADLAAGDAIGAAWDRRLQSMLLGASARTAALV